LKRVGLSCIDSVRCVAVAESEDDSIDLEQFLTELISVVVVVVVAFLVIVYIVLVTVVYMTSTDGDKSCLECVSFVCHSFRCCLICSACLTGDVNSAATLMA